MITTSTAVTPSTKVTCSSARNKDQKLVGHFLKTGYFIGYWLLSHWICTGSMADQNGFWLAKCWNCSEKGKWSTVIPSTDIEYKQVGCTVTVQLDSLVQKFLTILEKVMVSENNSYIQTMFPWISEIFLVKASSGYSLPLFSNSNRSWYYNN